MEYSVSPFKFSMFSLEVFIFIFEAVESLSDLSLEFILDWEFIFFELPICILELSFKLTIWNFQFIVVFCFESQNFIETNKLLSQFS